MLMGGLVIMLACALSFSGGIIFVIQPANGERLWVLLIGLGMFIASCFWLYKYFIGFG